MFFKKKPKNNHTVNKRSIRDIPIPENKKSHNHISFSDIIPNKKNHSKDEGGEIVSHKLKKEDRVEIDNYTPPVYVPGDHGVEVKEVHKTRRSGKGGSLSSKVVLWVITACICLAVIVSAISFFDKATVRITPQKRDVSINDVFVARKNPTEGGIKFELVKLSEDMGKGVAASGEEKVSIKASGEIIVYNNFSSASQVLIKNTRFESPSGLIYRINKDITVPGRTTKGTTVTPGSIKATIYADASGSEYNIPPSDFTIPGFKGTSKYEGFYARSVGGMSGGMSGTVKKVSSAVLALGRTELDSQLKESLIKKIRAQVPNDFVLFDDAVAYSFESLPQSNGGSDMATINERGTAYAVIFNKRVLSSLIAQKAITDLRDEKIDIPKLDSLTFAWEDKDSFKPEISESFSFKLNGPVSIVWQIDENGIKNELAGKLKKELWPVLQAFSSVERAEAFVFPFWKGSFPENPEKIKIEKMLP